MRKNEKAQIFWTSLLPPGLTVPLRGFLIRLYTGMRSHTLTPTRRLEAQGFHKKRCLRASVESKVLFNYLRVECLPGNQETVAGGWALEFKLAPYPPLPIIAHGPELFPIS